MILRPGPDDRRMVVPAHLKLKEWDPETRRTKAPIDALH